MTAALVRVPFRGRLGGADVDWSPVSRTIGCEGSDAPEWVQEERSHHGTTQAHARADHPQAA